MYGKHIKVWEDFMEVEVPFDDNGKKCHIHHLDGNPNNNDILNLVCMTESEHMKWHHNHRSKETLEKMSKSKLGNKNSLGNILSEETKKKISISKSSKRKEGEIWTNKCGKSFKKIDGKIIYLRKSVLEVK